MEGRRFSHRSPEPEAGRNLEGEELGIRDPLWPKMLAGDVPGGEGGPHRSKGDNSTLSGRLGSDGSAWHTTPPLQPHCYVTLGSLINLSASVPTSVKGGCCRPWLGRLEDQKLQGVQLSVQRPRAGSPQETRRRRWESEVGTSEERRELCGVSLRLPRLTQTQLIRKQGWRASTPVLQLS